MATYNDIINLINQNITSNGNEEITGSVMRSVLQQIAAWAQDHASNTNNPHGVTKAQVGLDKVQNLTPDELFAQLTLDDLPNGVLDENDLAVAIDNALAVIRDGVPTEGNTLNKLYNILIRVNSKIVNDPNYTVVLEDATKELRCYANEGTLVTLPSISTGIFPGFWGIAVNKGEGILQFQPGANAAIEAKGLSLEVQYEAAKFVCEGETGGVTTWGIYGPLV